MFYKWDDRQAARVKEAMKKFPADRTHPNPPTTRKPIATKVLRGNSAANGKTCSSGYMHIQSAL